MSQFIYQIRDNAGGSSSGTLTADSLDDASRMLRQEGKTIISIEESVTFDASQLAPPRDKKIRHDDVIFFATQLAVMVDTGVPLADALDCIAEQTVHTGLKKLVSDLAERVKAGVEFSKALESHPKHFSKLFVALMRASEASGTMGKMLQRVSEYMEQDRDTRKRIKGAMTYPVCMLSFCVLVVIALLAFVLPKFEKIYAGKGAALPMPTQILLSLSGVITGYWYLLILGLAGIIVGVYFYVRTPSGRMMLDNIRINMPVIGPMSRKACLARSLRTMSTMVSTGVGILDGLIITSQVAGNYYYAKIWTDLAEKIKEGSTLSSELFKCNLVPRSISQMIAAGEKTGKLSNVMDRVAGFCEDDLKVAVKTLTQMMEPVMIIVMGIIVGGIAIALLLPVFKLSKVITQH